MVPIDELSPPSMARNNEYQVKVLQYVIIIHPGQLSLAIPLWVGTVSMCNWLVMLAAL